LINDVTVRAGGITQRGGHVRESEVRVIDRFRSVLTLLVVVGSLGVPTAAAASSTAPDAHLTDLSISWGVSAASAGGPRISDPIELEPGTLLVGADWGGDEDALVEVRSRHAGEWGEWIPVVYEEHEGPDPSSDESQTTWSEPVLVGEAEAIQFRTDVASLAARGVVVDHGAATSSSSTVSASSVTATDSGNAKPNIVTRAQWGADESIRDPRVPSYAPTVRFGVVHHTAGGNDYTASQSAGIVRGIYEYHVKSRGFWDIGYNFLVDKYGQVFEGRYGGVDRAVTGAHAEGFNYASTGVSILGDFRNVPLPDAARYSLEQVLAWKFTIHHVDPQAKTTEVSGSDSAHWPSGQAVELPRIVGHRDLKSTSCPGSIIDLIHSGEIAASVGKRMGIQIYTDAPDRLRDPVIAPPTDLPVTTKGKADWRLDVKDGSGNTVRTSRWNGVRSLNASWDHKDANGDWVKHGNYRMVVSATLADGTKLPSISMPLRLTMSLPEWIPLVGDWNGNGKVQPGWWNQGKWILDDGAGGRISFWYGRAYDAPIVGDWNGDGKDEIGIIRDREWHLKRTASGGAADIVFTYGRMTRGDLPLVGDWNGDGKDEIGIVRDGEWHLRNSLSGGIADHTFIYGRVTRGDIPIIGNWDGKDGDTVGIVRDDEWHLKNRLAGGVADISFKYGRVTSGDIPIVGDWDGNGTTNVGIVRGAEWHLRTRHWGGSADIVWSFQGPS
jgi:hypothetical protein